MGSPRRIAALCAAALWVASAAGDAHAKPRTYRIAIETEPPGATVFLDDESGEELGTTPFQGRLEAGTYTIFIRREGHEPVYETISVKRKRRGRQTFSFELAEIRYGEVEVVGIGDGPDVRGALVLIDGAEMGNAPDVIRVAAGPHQVEVTKKGYELFEAWIDVEADETTTVEVELVPEDGAAVADAGDGGDLGDEDGGDRGGDGDGDDAGGDIEGAAPAAARRELPYVIASIGPEIAGRSFEYIAPETNNLRPYQAFGVPMLRVRAELYPLAGFGNRFLGGFGVAASYGRAAPVQSATDGNQTLATRWSDYHMSGRFRLALGAAYLGLEAGIGTQRFQFDAGGDPEKEMLFAEVPDVDYRFQRFGGDIGGTFAERWAASASFDYRVVSAIGTLQDRFERTTVAAMGGGVSLAFLLSPTWDVRLTGNYSRYTLDFEVGDGAEYAADKAIDQFFGAMLGIGYRL